jgi:hypothetical protein
MVVAVAALITDADWYVLQDYEATRVLEGLALDYMFAHNTVAELTFVPVHAFTQIAASPRIP